MSKTAWIVVLVVVVLIVGMTIASWFIPAALGSNYGYGMMGGRGMMGGGMMGGWGLMGGLGILFWVLIIAGGIWLYQSLKRNNAATNPNAPTLESPLDILKRRYAKGEITKEQFDTMKADLGG